MKDFADFLKLRGVEVFYDSTWIDSKTLRESAKNLKLSVNWSSSPPRIETGYISISHSKAGGMVGYSPSLIVGVDIEQISRLNLKVVQRVSIEGEFDHAPQPHFLWVAKEACFKAMYPNNDGLPFSHIRIGDWNKEEVGYSFKGSAKGSQLTGYLYEAPDYVAAIAFRVSY